ncbi:hypothetical protein [Ruegeria sp. HKCCA5426]|uniref:hypothetical protein n=1 Tax=Ruegeria sp. HKCCA5426 TaxID=2682985 RepID=UPI0014884D43|nr:hypothetical protein [Ruegeria sp. HKCCA5426]
MAIYNPDYDKNRGREPEWALIVTRLHTEGDNKKRAFPYWSQDDAKAVVSWVERVWGGSTSIIPIKGTPSDYNSSKDTFPREKLIWLLVLGSGDECVGFPQSSRVLAMDKAKALKDTGINRAEVIRLHQEPYGTAIASVKKFTTQGVPP